MLRDGKVVESTAGESVQKEPMGAPAGQALLFDFDDEPEAPRRERRRPKVTVISDLPKPPPAFPQVEKDMLKYYQDKTKQDEETMADLRKERDRWRDERDQAAENFGVIKGHMAAIAEALGLDPAVEHTPGEIAAEVELRKEELNHAEAITANADRMLECLRAIAKVLDLEPGREYTPEEVAAEVKGLAKEFQEAKDIITVMAEQRAEEQLREMAEPKVSREAELEAQVGALTGENVDLKNQVDRLTRAGETEALKALEDLVDIIKHSQGVTGWHKNGDVALWEEFGWPGSLEDILDGREREFTPAEAAKWEASTLGDVIKERDDLQAQLEQLKAEVARLQKEGADAKTQRLLKRIEDLEKDLKAEQYNRKQAAKRDLGIINDLQQQLEEERTVTRTSRGRDEDSEREKAGSEAIYDRLLETTEKANKALDEAGITQESRPGHPLTLEKRISKLRDERDSYKTQRDHLSKRLQGGEGAC